jgi:integrase
VLEPVIDAQAHGRVDVEGVLRYSFVSLLSDGGVPIGDIADLCGHSGTWVTEKVHHYQLRPVGHGSDLRREPAY